MIARTVWVVLCGALAFATLQLQLDRQAAREPEYARFVLEPFRANAQFIRTARELYGQDTDAALAEARILVQRRPIPAEHLTLLAGAYYQDEQIDRASLAVQFAAQRGWRDTVAQEARLRLALEAGDEAEAARRFVALMLSPNLNGASLREMGQAVFAGPPGEAESVLVDLVVETDRWHPLLLRHGPSLMPPPAFADVIARSLARGVRLDCAALRRAIGTLKKQDQASAQQLRDAVEAQC